MTGTWAGTVMAERIVLAERLDTVGAAALAAELMQHPADGHVVLDGSVVAHFGAQAVQVVVSAPRTISAAGGSLECTDMNNRAAAQLQAMGLSTSDLTEVAQ